MREVTSFKKGGNCNICYFPLLQWWGQKINLGFSFFFGVRNFRTFTVQSERVKILKHLLEAVQVGYTLTESDCFQHYHAPKNCNWNLHPFFRGFVVFLLACESVSKVVTKPCCRCVKIREVSLEAYFDEFSFPKEKIAMIKTVHILFNWLIFYIAESACHVYRCENNKIHRGYKVGRNYHYHECWFV